MKAFTSCYLGLFLSIAAAADPITITTASPLPNGGVSRNYVKILSASGGSGSYNWTLVSGSLPEGLFLNGYIVNGIAMVKGTASFRLRATDSSNAAAYAEKDFSLTIGNTPILIGTGTLNWATEGVPYSAPLNAVGGTELFTWSVVSGSLPAGLTLTPAGTITGTPTTAINPAAFRVRVTDSENAYAEADFTLTVQFGGPVGVTEPIVWYNGDMGGSFSISNQISLTNSSIDFMVYDNFTVPTRTHVTSVFSYNLTSPGFVPVGARWEIRSGVSAGNGGVVIAAGTVVSGFGWKPTGRWNFTGRTEYALIVSGLSVNLAAGEYWLAVAPIGELASGSLLSGSFGLRSLGNLHPNDGKSYGATFYQTYPGAGFRDFCAGLSGRCDFSLGISGSALPASPSRIGTYNTGQWRMDVSGNGTLETNGDREFFLGWAGATVVQGDWNGDGRAKAGVYSGGYWFLDYNGDGVWDGGVNDKLIGWGWSGAAPIVGDWNGDGKTKIGVYSNGFWFLDYNGDYLWDGGIVDKQVGWGWSGVTPIVGDWNGNGKTKIGVFVNGFWFLDYNGDYLWDGGVVDKQAGWGWSGVTPVVGDWSGSGRTKIGVYAGGFWYLDYDGNYLWQYPGGDMVWAVGWTGTTPVMGDWNGDGRTKAGAFINGYWYLDYDGNGTFDGTGTDRVYAFGSQADTPVVGKW
jgi:hypothetical protein